MPVSMMATLMFSPRKPGVPLHTDGAPMKGTLMELSRLWVATRFTSTTPGSDASAAIWPGAACTLMPLMAFWKCATPVPPFASMAVTSAACCAASALSMPALSATAICLFALLLRTTATGSPASLSTTVIGCSNFGFWVILRLESARGVTRLSAIFEACSETWMSAESADPSRLDAQAETRAAERRSERRIIVQTLEWDGPGFWDARSSHSGGPTSIGRSTAGGRSAQAADAVGRADSEALHHLAVDGRVTAGRDVERRNRAQVAFVQLRELHFLDLRRVARQRSGLVERASVAARIDGAERVGEHLDLVAVHRPRRIIEAPDHADLPEHEAHRGIDSALAQEKIGGFVALQAIRTGVDAEVRDQACIGRDAREHRGLESLVARELHSRVRRHGEHARVSVENEADPPAAAHLGEDAFCHGRIRAQAVLADRGEVMQRLRPAVQPTDGSPPELIGEERSPLHRRGCHSGHRRQPPPRF